MHIRTTEARTWQNADEQLEGGGLAACGGGYPTSVLRGFCPALSVEGRLT